MASLIRQFRMNEYIRTYWLGQIYSCNTILQVQKLRYKIYLVEKILLIIAEKLFVGYQLLDELEIEYGKIRSYFKY